MRITTGEFKGRTIRTVRDLSVRPATDRVRQTVFNMLVHRMVLDGTAVLDLFAGSGSLGLEALSRGARSVVFVESATAAARMLGANLEAFGCADRAEVVRDDAVAFIRRESTAYDLVFADPPYAYDETPRLPGLIFGRGLVKPGGYLLIEHEAGLAFAPAASHAAGPARRFGRTVVTFFQGRKP